MAELYPSNFSRYNLIHFTFVQCKGDIPVTFSDLPYNPPIFIHNKYPVPGFCLLKAEFRRIAGAVRNKNEAVILWISPLKLQSLSVLKAQTEVSSAPGQIFLANRLLNFISVFNFCLFNRPVPIHPRFGIDLAAIAYSLLRSLQSLSAASCRSAWIFALQSLKIFSDLPAGFAFTCVLPAS